MSILGHNARIYVQEGAYSSGTTSLTLIKRIRDVQITNSKPEIDDTDRECNGVMQYMHGLLEFAVEFDQVWEPEENSVVLLQDALRDEDTLDCFIVDRDISDPDASGVRASMIVTKYDQGEPLNGQQTRSVRMVPGKPVDSSQSASIIVWPGS